MLPVGRTVEGPRKGRAGLLDLTPGWEADEACLVLIGVWPGHSVAHTAWRQASEGPAALTPRL